MSKREKKTTSDKDKKKKVSKSRGSSKKKSANKRGKRTSTSQGRVASRYNLVQRILKAYCDSNDKRLGRKFNYYASKINKATAGVPIEQVENNIDELYAIHVESNAKRRVFPNDFPFYEFADKLISDPSLEGVKIGLVFKDNGNDFEFEGDSSDMLDYYRINLHKYLRTNYNDSPVAVFRILETDETTYVDYEIVVLGSGQVPSGGRGVPQEPSKPKESEEGDAKARADEARAKAVLKALELFEKGLLSKEQLDMILTKLQKGGNI